MLDGHHLENQKITISPKPFVHFDKILHGDTHFPCRPLRLFKSLNLKKSKMVDNHHFENVDCHIFTTI